MDKLTFTKTIKTDDGDDLALTRITDDAADANTLRAQGWTEKKQPTLPVPPASTQPNRD